LTRLAGTGLQRAAEDGGPPGRRLRRRVVSASRTPGASL